MSVVEASMYFYAARYDHHALSINRLLSSQFTLTRSIELVGFEILVK